VCFPGRDLFADVFCPKTVVWGLTKAQQRGMWCPACGVKIHDRCAGRMESHECSESMLDQLPGM
jgi:hypothetical protein